MIQVKKIDESTYQVGVDQGTKTQHRVSLADDYYQKLTQSKISKEELIQKSFEFLLERESNTMILTSFDLPLIQHYFPEYERVIQNNI